ncbi:MAG: hypothetical protein AAF402_05775, partial [Pseudomonadota bacterium]
MIANVANLTRNHRALLVFAVVVLITEVFLLGYFRDAVVQWLSHNLWIVVIPFTKGILQKVITLKLIAVIKLITVLLYHLL